ncbi:MAG: NADH:flavin oxidoreductase/NADH oxidase [Bacteroidota bacterium]
MANLFTPLPIREIRLRNRIAVSPMCQYSAVDGMANDWHLVHLGTRAAGGAGLIIMEATAVSPEGRISVADLGLWKDEQIQPLRRITAFLRAQDAVPALQLAHAGRKGSHSEPWKGGLLLGPADGGWPTVGASAIPFAPGERAPEALTPEGIRRITGSFRSAALRALEAGFLAVEIHAAHGYLLHQFLSPLCNDRTDEYGGDFPRRSRFLMEVVRTVREVWPERLPLLVRISCTDWAEGGWTLEDSLSLALMLKDAGVDLVDCSSGGILPDIPVPAAPGYQVPLAAKIRTEARILTGAVGLITLPAQAQAIVTGEKADLVLLGREFLRNPYFPLGAAAELGCEVSWPAPYLRARRPPP